MPATRQAGFQSRSRNHCAGRCPSLSRTRGGINLLNKAKSPAELQAKTAALQARGVVFAACANSMAKNGYTMDDMVDGAAQVPSGAAEVIRKQQGWLYMHS